MATDKVEGARRPSAAEQLNIQVKRDAIEKKKEGSVWLVRLIAIMACIYFADVLMLDNLLYGIVGFFASLLGSISDGLGADTWVATTKASLSSIKVVVFLGATCGATFLAKMRS